MANASRDTIDDPYCCDINARAREQAVQRECWRIEITADLHCAVTRRFCAGRYTVGCYLYCILLELNGIKQIDGNITIYMS